jgi:phytoene desaturase
VARVVVIGAGMGGLAVAARLARLCHDVTVCEHAPTYGGQAGAYSRDGFTFDTGPSLLTLPAVWRDLFMKTGKRQPLEDVVDLVPADPAVRYGFPDGTVVDVPNASRRGIVEAFSAALGDGAGEDWDRLIERAGRIWAVTRGPLAESPPGGWRELSRLARRPGDVRTVAPGRTLRGLGRGYLRDPRLRTVLDRYAAYAGSDPRRAPAALAVLPYIEQTFGAWYVRGGVRRLADAVYERAQTRGADFRFGAEVTEVLVDAGRVSGVRLGDGQRLAADIVVSDADAVRLYGELVRPPRQARRVLRAPRSGSAFALLLALRGRLNVGAPHHTVLLPAADDAEFDAVFGRRPAPVSEPAIHICAPDDPGLRPDGHEAWTVRVSAPLQGPVDWTAPDLAESYAEQLLALLAKRGLDIRDRLLWRVIRTPADIERETRSPGGAIHGAAAHGPLATFRRPANRAPIPGLFLVGGSAHPGGGLPFVGVSAALVADMVGRA